MLDFITVVLRAISLFCGFLFIYSALFLYEDEQGRIQNTLESLWVRINDSHRYFISKHTMFMRVVANLTSSVVDRLLGERLFSLKFLGVSILSSWASIIFISLLHSLNGEANSGTITFTITFLALISFGTIPLFIKSDKWMKEWFVIVLSFHCPMIVLWALQISPPLPGERLTFMALILTVLCLGILCDMFFIIVTRKLLRWSSGLESFYKIVAVILLDSLMAFSLVIAPLVCIFWLYKDPFGDERKYTAFVVLFTAFSNLLDAFIATLFLVLALIILAHRLLWPLFERPVYSLQKLGIAKRSKLLGTIGVVLVSVALGAEPTWLKSIVDRFD